MDSSDEKSNVEKIKGLLWSCSPHQKAMLRKYLPSLDMSTVQLADYLCSEHTLSKPPEEKSASSVQCSRCNSSRVIIGLGLEENAQACQTCWDAYGEFLNKTKRKNTINFLTWAKTSYIGTCHRCGACAPQKLSPTVGNPLAHSTRIAGFPINACKICWIKWNKAVKLNYVSFLKWSSHNPFEPHASPKIPDLLETHALPKAPASKEPDVLTCYRCGAVAPQRVTEGTSYKNPLSMSSADAGFNVCACRKCWSHYLNAATEEMNSKCKSFYIWAKAYPTATVVTVIDEGSRLLGAWPCDCGAKKCGTTHANWCATKKGS